MAPCVARLFPMSLANTSRAALTVALTLALGLVAACPALGAPSTADERARVDAATSRYEAARARAASLDAGLAKASEELDEIVAEEEGAQRRLRTRALSMYRNGEVSLIEVLLGAESFREFAVRWELLTRLSRQDAVDIEALARARAKAKRTAAKLMKLQAEQARAVDATSREVAAARRDLAARQAALAAYEARVRSANTPRGTAAAGNGTSKRADATQRLRGTGAWKTGVASHYSRTFTGRGANGERIGPYSMMVAHKTLPFGTLIEFEYRGRRAVAKVADRGPFTPGRDFDLGPGVVRALDFSGVHTVRYRIIGK